MMNVAAFRRRPYCRVDAVIAIVGGYTITKCLEQGDAHCEVSSPKNQLPPGTTRTDGVSPAPSWFRRNVLLSIGIPLPIPRVLSAHDPALTLSKYLIQRRMRDEVIVRNLLEQMKPKLAPSQQLSIEDIRALHERICEATFGKGVTAQMREDFLARYGCTGWNDQVLETLMNICDGRGIVEIGAGHGQWARALSEAYQQRYPATKSRKKFDFVLAYDDMSNLPLDTHIYNPYTQPHHHYFGDVYRLDVKNTARLLQSWACRGRVLLLVYPPPGDMAIKIVKEYVNAAPENDTVVLVAEGRGGANGDDALFDFFENGEWVLLQILDVKHPPGDKGYEKMYILQRREGFKDLRFEY